MTRRDALFTRGAGALLASTQSLLHAAQVDPDFVRFWTDAQKEQPTAIGSVARIAPVDEPGTPFVLQARLFQPDGVTPVSGGIVFAYHTDRDGLYRPAGTRDWWRLKGWAKTTANGEFEFRTIRPAPYPDRKTPAHIHIGLDGPRGSREAFGLQFADDPLVSQADRTTAAEKGRFSDLAVVETRGGVQHCSMLFRLTGKNLF